MSMIAKNALSQVKRLCSSPSFGGNVYRLFFFYILERKLILLSLKIQSTDFFVWERKSVGLIAVVCILQSVEEQNYSDKNIKYSTYG